MTKVSKILTSKPSIKKYDRFEVLDGRHPWRDSVPEGYIPYRAFELDHGKVSYFNFHLAKEMGLIPRAHRHHMNKTLERKILKTFALQIINEYDLINKTKIPQKKIKSQSYMASRYLQLQHPNKQGKTSGDGRGLWNGSIQHRGVTWDVNSRGTGVTKLAPGSVISSTPLKTGSSLVGYGCGLVEIDELYSSAIMSETLHRQGYKTERTLAIIDLGKGVAIGVRAAPNLFRPAHLFPYLKQGKYAPLKRAVDYIIQRQCDNGEWNFRKKAPYKYQDFLQQICHDFAKFAAWLEADYIFAWLDWDGDNTLINAGIIDYGSIRQLGLRHDQYRYDDVERWSTNLNEQKSKAKLIIQVFAQMIDFLENREKKSLKEFSQSYILKDFENHFKHYHTERTLYRMGFNKEQRTYLIEKQGRKINDLLNTFSYLEKYKVQKTTVKVEDGINRPPALNTCEILKQLPGLCFNQDFDTKVTFKSWLSVFSGRKDKANLPKMEKHFFQLIKEYQRVLITLEKNFSISRGSLTQLLRKRAERLHGETKMTGNALVHVVWSLLKKRKKFSDKDIQSVMEQIILEQSQVPESQKVSLTSVPSMNPQKEKFLEELNELACLYNQDI